MSDSNEVQDKKALQGAIRASGFPFQMRVADIIREVLGEDGQVEEEVSWDSNSGGNYLDITARPQLMILAVECKKSARKGLIFPIRANWTAEDENGASCLSIVHNRRMEVAVGWWRLGPPCRHSMYAISAGKDGNSDGHLIERDIYQLLKGSFSRARTFWLQDRRTERTRDAWPIVPIYVTNCQLFEKAFDTSMVSLVSGQLPDAEADKDLTSVAWIRFTKTMLTDPDRDLPPLTTFIVNADSLHPFLKELHARPPEKPLNWNTRFVTM